MKTNIFSLLCCLVLTLALAACEEKPHEVDPCMGKNQAQCKDEGTKLIGADPNHTCAYWAANGIIDRESSGVLPAGRKIVTPVPKPTVAACIKVNVVAESSGDEPNPAEANCVGQSNTNCANTQGCVYNSMRRPEIACVLSAELGGRNTGRPTICDQRSKDSCVEANKCQLGDRRAVSGIVCINAPGNPEEEIPSGSSITTAAQAKEKANTCSDTAMTNFCKSGSSEATPGARIEIKNGRTCFVTGKQDGQACIAGPDATASAVCAFVDDNKNLFLNISIAESSCNAAVDAPEGRICKFNAGACRADTTPPPPRSLRVAQCSDVRYRREFTHAAVEEKKTLCENALPDAGQCGVSTVFIDANKVLCVARGNENDAKAAISTGDVANCAELKASACDNAESELPRAVIPGATAKGAITIGSYSAAICMQPLDGSGACVPAPQGSGTTECKPIKSDDPALRSQVDDICKLVAEQDRSIGGNPVKEAIPGIIDAKTKVGCIGNRDLTIPGSIGSFCANTDGKKACHRNDAVMSTTGSALCRGNITKQLVVFINDGRFRLALGYPEPGTKNSRCEYGYLEYTIPTIHPDNWFFPTTGSLTLKSKKTLSETTGCKLSRD
jgi:hypothetical protein